MKPIRKVSWFIMLLALHWASSSNTRFQEKRHVDASKLLTETIKTISNIVDDTVCSIFCAQEGYSCNGFLVDIEQRQCNLHNLYGTSFPEGNDVINFKYHTPGSIGVPKKLLCGLKFTNETWNVFVTNTADGSVCRTTTLTSLCIGANVIVKNRWLYCLGGLLATVSVDWVLFLDLTLPWQDWDWTMMQHMPEKMITNRIATMDGKIYSFGGKTENDNTVIADHSLKLFIYDIDNDSWTTKADGLSFDLAARGNIVGAFPVPGKGKILLQTATSKDILVFDTVVDDILPEETISSPVPDTADLNRPMMFLKDDQGGWTPTMVYQTLNLGTFGLDLNNLDQGFQLLSDHNYTRHSSILHYQLGEENGLFAVPGNAADTWNDELKQYVPAPEYTFRVGSECIAHEAIKNIPCSP